MLSKFRMLALAATTILAASAISAQADTTKIGYLAALTGATSALSGESSIPAIQMAIEDFGGKSLGEPIEFIKGDYLGKPDVGLSVAREWIDQQGVDVILGLDNSAVALAVGDLVKEKNINALMIAAAMAVTNEKCSDVSTQWLMDSYGLTRAITLPVYEAGNNDWFFITVDYAFGHDIEAKAMDALKGAGANIIGAVRHSPETTDFSSFLLEAQSRGAKTIALPTFGTWQTAIIKQAKEFGINATLVPFFLGDTDVNSIGQENIANVQTALQWYWNSDDTTREFTKRFRERYNRPPTFTNALAYQAVTHYLKAVEAAGTREAKAVQAKMIETPIEDKTGFKGYIRPDGRVMRDMYSVKVKAPGESQGDWDYFTVTGTIDKEKVALPLAESKCSLVKK